MASGERPTFAAPRIASAISVAVAQTMARSWSAARPAAAVEMAVAVLAAAAAKTATAISTAAAGLAADQLRAIVCATATEIADAIRGAAKVGRSPLATVVALPLTRDGRLVGVLVATSQAPGVADETALRALEAAGRVCAIRLDLERAFTSRSRAAGAPAASVLVTGTTVAV